MDYVDLIIDSLFEHCNEDLQEILPVLSELYHFTKDYQFDEKIEVLCMKNNLCKKCFSKLTTYQEEDLIGEYMGQPAYQTLYHRVCPECGYFVPEF